MDNLPNIGSLGAYEDALNDVSKSFEIFAKQIKQTLPSKDSQEMWWSLYCGFHKIIQYHQMRADKAVNSLLDDMWRKSQENEDEIPF